MTDQAEKFGLSIKTNDVVSVDLAGTVKKIHRIALPLLKVTLSYFITEPARLPQAWIPSHSQNYFSLQFK
jgi:hypothetical protein